MHVRQYMADLLLQENSQTRTHNHMRNLYELYIHSFCSAAIQERARAARALHRAVISANTRRQINA